MKAGFFGPAVIYLAVLLLGCGNGAGKAVGKGEWPKDLAGQWTYLCGSKEKAPVTMVLFKDGTAVAPDGNFLWKVENKRFLTTNLLNCGYKSEKGKLTLTYTDNTSTTFLNKDRFVMENEVSSFTDKRDGKVYKTVRIAEQVWFGENLNFEPENGIAWCYGDDGSNCAQYGRLYDWETAKAVCPSGWHLPGRGEWDELVGVVNFAGKGNIASNMLRTTHGWEDERNGFDLYGFSGLPGGARYIDGHFGYVISNGHWWTATEVVGGGDAYYRNMNAAFADVGEGSHDVGTGFSVRCLLGGGAEKPDTQD
jgi:uncharacterized protein (TIGR02145 family)